MNVLIIEDEPLAAQRLETLLAQLRPDSVVVQKIDTVKRSVQWLTSHPAPDLIMLDIHLADGISFQIFEQCEVKCPVIFTTAYDEYALKAFKVNSIDYMLKPVDANELQNALRKLDSLKGTTPGPHAVLNDLDNLMKMLTRRYKERYIIKVGERLKSISVGNILYFSSMEKTTFAHTDDGRQHILDFTLDQVEEQVDPQVFFRVNRKYVIAMGSILDMINHTNSRLRLILKGTDADDVIVARERVAAFKGWLDR